MERTICWKPSRGFLLSHRWKVRLQLVALLTVLNGSFVSHVMAQSSIQWTANTSLSVTFGTQNNAVKWTSNIAAVTGAYGIATELNAGIGLEFFSRKFGVKTKSSVLSWESYALLGPERGGTKAPFYAGDMSLISPASNPLLPDQVYGVGLGAKQDLIKGELSSLGNRQGIFITRLKVDHRPLTIRIQNDFRAFLFFGSGTDQGITGHGHISYHYLDPSGHLHQLGVHVVLITPEPDYSKNPNAALNSDYGSKPVLPTLEPFSNLFHGNFYLSYGVASPYFNQRIELGVDSQRWGAKVQNMIHDGFGLYARFPWDIGRKNQWYFQSQTGVCYGL